MITPRAMAMAMAYGQDAGRRSWRRRPIRTSRPGTVNTVWRRVAAVTAEPHPRLKRPGARRSRQTGGTRPPCSSPGHDYPPARSQLADAKISGGFAKRLLSRLMTGTRNPHLRLDPRLLTRQAPGERLLAAAMVRPCAKHYPCSPADGPAPSGPPTGGCTCLMLPTTYIPSSFYIVA